MNHFLSVLLSWTPFVGLWWWLYTALVEAPMAMLVAHIIMRFVRGLNDYEEVGEDEA